MIHQAIIDSLSDIELGVVLHSLRRTESDVNIIRSCKLPELLKTLEKCKKDVLPENQYIFDFIKIKLNTPLSMIKSYTEDERIHCLSGSYISSPLLGGENPSIEGLHPQLEA